MKKIVIAIDSFKGCLSSAEAGEAGGMGGGLLASHPERLSLGVFFVYRVLHLLLEITIEILSKIGTVGYDLFVTFV